MPPETKIHSSQDSFIDVLHSEIIAGSENLSAWIKQLNAQGAIDNLFGFIHRRHFVILRAGRRIDSVPDQKCTLESFTGFRGFMDCSGYGYVLHCHS
jgi:hypothetical protein